MSQQAPILAEQARSTSPCGCGCLIFLLAVAAIVVGAGTSLFDSLDDSFDERVAPLPGASAPDGGIARAEACRAAGRAVAAADAPGPRRIPRDLSRLLIDDAPLPGFIDGERLVAEVDTARWASGLGSPARWRIAFERSGFRRGLQHFWSDPTGANRMTHQVLVFATEDGAQEFHRFYNRELCGRAEGVGPVRGVTGGVRFLRDDPQGWSSEATFVRGPLLIYVGLLSADRVPDDPRLTVIARAADARARP